MSLTPQLKFLAGSSSEIYIENVRNLAVSWSILNVNWQMRPRSVATMPFSTWTAIHTELCEQMRPTADSTSSKFQVDRTNHIDTAVDARNPSLFRAITGSTAGQWPLSVSRPSNVGPLFHVRFGWNLAETCQLYRPTLRTNFTGI